MTTPSRASRARAVGQRKTSDTATVLSEGVRSRTDRLVDISDHCAAAKETAEDIGEGFLAFLLSMVVEETQTAMRRAALGIPPPARKERFTKPVS